MNELSSDILRDSITTLHGDALDAALARRFVLADEVVVVGDTSFMLRKPANADHLISEADYVMDERLPYWADLWPSARQLATTLLGERGAGRTLLELGCGLGLPTLASMHVGFDVTATDYYEDALQVTRANAGRNLGREPHVRMVNWRAWPEDLGQFDVVVAADVIYEQEYAVLVAACIARALLPGGVAIVADPGRVALARFLTELPQVGLEIVSTTTTPYVDGKINQQIQVMRVQHITVSA
jgi:predicted nicotinamide N-methyase